MRIRFLIVLTCLLFLTGCVPNIGLGGREETILTEQFVEGKVVEGFPALPLFPKSEVIESYGKDGKYGAAFISSGDLVKVVNFYNDSLPRSGWQVSLKQQSETNYFFEIKNDQLEGAIIINTAADGKKTAITISTAPR
ncbi:hypothetical protein A3F02_02400 [Candidatus Curtissbacteria bacterium RIFCSPHIGHO2_12_FULL_38_9b]|uniref:Uncharacterized protein n=2 Tax=Candidatus Curtissiibacteriota TaxID=1752717 RepID=A0A1F5GWS7_9BACT|nr:MAG: hypothetical protein A3A48_01290 [Candidatus Curtissbacteria bacterium RIFCSPLOWO2_01_FULL_37_9]OGD96227.1 MAG: hypothetical protein A3F02_02400 [Candidatus Curtissbacteria bacterium RIFCSPHIGHO2_12_FULL_38_9b]